MRSVLVLGLLITLCASANAATVRRSKPPEGHLRPGQRVTVPKGYAVCQSGRMSAPRRPVHMIKLTEMREISPYTWVHPDEERQGRRAFP